MSLCRICNQPLEKVLDLGSIYQSGNFTCRAEPEFLSLARCLKCNVFQLWDRYPVTNYYGPDYGYESALNSFMVDHLYSIVQSIEEKLPNIGTWLDIGSNDASLLSLASVDSRKIGIDPSAARFQKKYHDLNIKLIVDFFSKNLLKKYSMNAASIDVITSIAMFYDIEKPFDFISAVDELLSPAGIWVSEQSYFFKLLENLAFDSICHEHIFYYNIGDIHKFLKKYDLEIFDLHINDVNGSSFCIYVGRKGRRLISPRVNEALVQERTRNVDLELKNFKNTLDKAKTEIKNHINNFKEDGKRIFGLGASTKGNVFLQYFGLDDTIIECIGEINPIKFGCKTPGSNIPIVPESEILGLDNSVFIVLPWHFKQAFLTAEKYSGKNLFFPFPSPELIKRK